ncbi:MAG TPA: amidohydrolase family protein [Alphaproteobacteria bacterium]|nr:amidohydrolase family protein [Alphaproteobacteria bacterium]
MAERELRKGPPPACQGPDLAPRPPRFAVPRGAVDCHAHVIAPPERFPYVAERSYTPPPASPEAYFAMHDRLGIARGVLVQVSVHGTDNRYMVEVLRARPRRLRGIAVVAADAANAALEALHEAGIRGVRLNVLFGGGIGLEALEPLAQRIKELGWHIQLLVDGPGLVALAPRLLELPVPFVIDHMGYMPAAAGVAQPGFQTLLRLLREGDCWVKLSGANRLSRGPIPYRDTVPFARALVAARPERLVWGSDWPHVAIEGPMVNDGDLLDLFAEWVPDAATRRLILVDNPAKLYGFPTL